MPKRPSFATHADSWRQPTRGSKRRLKRLRRQVTRREIVLAVLAGIGLLLLSMLSLASGLKHREEHRRRNSGESEGRRPSE